MKAKTKKALTRVDDHVAVKNNEAKPSTRRRGTELVIEGGQTDSACVRSVIREWLVPLLVREFIAEKRALLAEDSVTVTKSTFRPLIEER